MNGLRFERLAAIKTPLVNKFYNTHNARGRANKQDQVWVAYHEYEIIGACRIQHRESHLFLSTLLVTPLWRGKKVAKQLLTIALKAQSQVVYTFAYHHLLDFYSGLGFAEQRSLPVLLDTLYKSYSNRNIVAMIYKVTSLPPLQENK